MTIARDAVSAAVTPYAANLYARMGGFYALATYTAGTKRGDVGSVHAIVPYASGLSAVPRVGDVSMQAVFSTAEPSVEQSLAWTFTMDGHTFYVLDLGNEGTFLYDIDSQNWCKYQTDGFPIWNLRNGTNWNTGANRVVGGDWSGPYLWELDPDNLFDDDFRDVTHAATAGLVLRSRVYHSMAELRIAASAGLLDDTTGSAFIQLTYSDDDGQTYSAPVVVQLIAGTTPDGQQDIRFSSLGSFMAPGRVLQIADVGGVLRLDGVDAMIDGFDEPNGPFQG